MIMKYDILLTMDGAWKRALYNSWLFIFSEQQKHNMFSSAFLIQNVLIIFPIFKMLCTQKQAGTNHVFYLVMPHEIEVVKSKILDEGPVPKKA